MRLANFIFPAYVHVLTSITLANGAPYDIVNSNLNQRCVMVGADLCADTNFGGYCHAFVMCQNYCLDLVDYGMKGSFGLGVSSFVLPDWVSCDFWDGRECTGNVFHGMTTMQDMPGFNDVTLSFSCWNSTDCGPLLSINCQG